MSKEILILTGSPRKGANSSAMANAFIEGARESGHVTHKLDTALMKLSGCRACDSCWSTGTACVIRDDFTNIEPFFERCDVLVLAVPLYWFSFPAQIKCVIDRLYAYGGLGGERKLAIKESVLLLTCGDTNEGQLTGIKQSYEWMSGFLNWKERGMLWQGGLTNPGDIEHTDALHRAYEFGRNI